MLVETELWPNLIHEAHRRGTRIALVNGRISTRSFPRYRKARRFLSRVLSEIDLFLMQGEAHAERIRALGAPADRVQVTGNLKFDAVAPGRVPERLARLLQGGTAPRPLWVAGSTVGGEEELVLSAFHRVRERVPQARLLVAPRHPERFAAVPALVEAAGFRCLRRSALDPAAWGDGEVLLLDTLGELAQVYALASVVFVGGSLVPAGGHNILEPAVAGKAVVVGPHMENFQEIADQFRAESAMVQVELPGRARARGLGSPSRRGSPPRPGRAGPRPGGPQPRRPEPHHGRALVAAGVRRLLGSAFGALASLRVAAYRRGLLPRARLAGPVVSVGNLGVGGSGKTPVVARVAEILRDAGRPVAVLSRGYGGSFRGETLVVSDGARVLAGAAEAGDEPVMLARALPGVVVAVGARRDVVGRAVEARFGRRVHVLDDGFQHLRLERDLDLVCLDVRDLEDRPMPAGRLRERPSALLRASLVLLTRIEAASEAELRALEARLSPERTFRVARRVAGWQALDGAAAAPPARAFLLAAIARPERFERDVAGCGVGVLGRAFFATTTASARRSSPGWRRRPAPPGRRRS